MQKTKKKEFLKPIAVAAFVTLGLLAAYHVFGLLDGMTVILPSAICWTAIAINAIRKKYGVQEFYAMSVMLCVGILMLCLALSIAQGAIRPDGAEISKEVSNAVDITGSLKSGMVEASCIASAMAVVSILGLAVENRDKAQKPKKEEKP